MLEAFDLFQFAVALLPPKPNLSPLWNAHEIMLPKRFGRTRMWLNNVGRPSNSHVVDNIEVERPEFGGDQRSAIQAGTRHFAELVRNNAIFGNRFVKSKCQDVDLMTATHQRTSKLPSPMLGATADGVELFQDERDFHKEEGENINELLKLTAEGPGSPFPRRAQHFSRREFPF